MSKRQKKHRNKASYSSCIPWLLSLSGTVKPAKGASDAKTKTSAQMLGVAAMPHGFNATLIFLSLLTESMTHLLFHKAVKCMFLWQPFFLNNCQAWLVVLCDKEIINWSQKWTNKDLGQCLWTLTGDYLCNLSTYFFILGEVDCTWRLEVITGWN